MSQSGQSCPFWDNREKGVKVRRGRAAFGTVFRRRELPEKDPLAKSKKLSYIILRQACPEQSRRAQHERIFKQVQILTDSLAPVGGYDSNGERASGPCPLQDDQRYQASLVESNYELGRLEGREEGKLEVAGISVELLRNNSH